MSVCVYWHKQDRLRPNAMCSGSHDLFKDLEISDNIVKMSFDIEAM